MQTREHIVCPYCNGIHSQIRYGIDFPSITDKYFCSNCNRYFTVELSVVENVRPEKKECR